MRNDPRSAGSAPIYSHFLCLWQCLPLLTCCIRSFHSAFPQLSRDFLDLCRSFGSAFRICTRDRWVLSLFFPRSRPSVVLLLFVGIAIGMILVMFSVIVLLGACGYEYTIWYVGTLGKALSNDTTLKHVRCTILVKWPGHCLVEEDFSLNLIGILGLFFRAISNLQYKYLLILSTCFLKGI